MADCRWEYDMVRSTKLGLYLTELCSSTCSSSLFSHDFVDDFMNDGRDAVEPSPPSGSDDARQCKGPRTFYDVESINSENPHTAHIRSALVQWEWVSNQSGSRRGTRTKQLDCIIEELMGKDTTQEQPSWIQQWIDLVYKSYGDDTTNATLTPTNEQFRLLLEYFVRLDQDPVDTEEHALRVLNAERKRCGFYHTLEYGSLRRVNTACLEANETNEFHPQSGSSSQELPIHRKEPATFYDVESITTENPYTVHIRFALDKWHWVSSQSGSRRGAKSQQLDSIIEELMEKDEAQEQPSWIRGWVSLAYGFFGADTTKVTLPPLKEQFRRLLEYFVCLDEDPLDREEYALRGLNAERKRCGFYQTLEYGPLHKAKAARLEMKGNTGYRPLFGGASPPPELIRHKRTHSLKSNSSGTSHATSITSPQTSPTNSPIRSQPARPIVPLWTPPRRIPMSMTDNNVEYPKDSTVSTGPANLTSNYAAFLAENGRVSPDRSIPHVWAYTRPDLCESVPYFRSFQGGIHRDKKSGMMGYLLDGHPAPGDIWANDGRFIVSHGGGSSRAENAKASASSPSKPPKVDPPISREVSSSSIKYPRNSADEMLCNFGGSTTPASSPSKKDAKVEARRFLACDQSPHRWIKALLQAKEDEIPIVLIVGRDYRWWPLEMDIASNMGEDSSQDGVERGRYTVLGWYSIRDAWPELEPGRPNGLDGEHTPLFIRWRFAFEWIEEQGTPWWVQTLERAQAEKEHMEEGAIDNVLPDPGIYGDETIERGDISHAISSVPGPSMTVIEEGEAEIPPPESGTYEDETNEQKDTAHAASSVPDPSTSVIAEINEQEDIAHAVSSVLNPSMIIMEEEATDDPPPGSGSYGDEINEQEDTAYIVSPVPEPQVTVITEQACLKCERRSSRIYHEGWFCLNPSCSQFCMLLDGRLSTEITLTYSYDFVSRPPSDGTEFQGIKSLAVSDYLGPGPWSLIPTHGKGLDSFSREHWQGRHCSQCGRLNPKISWEEWKCQTCECLIEMAPKTIYPAQQFMDGCPELTLDYRADNFISYQDLHNIPGFNTLRINIPDAGDIYWLRPDNLQEANKLFQLYQEQALERPMFKRSLLKSSFVTGQHTCHFLHNAGLHYDFCCKIVTEDFDSGPPVVKECRDLLSEYVTKVLDRHMDFNEVLSCAYKKEQSMNFHSDDELGVQGTIATFSLGSTAKMSFRAKSESASVENICLELNLRHGDLLIMDGISIQNKYLHRVVSSGLRFAATARVIDPEMLRQLDNKRYRRSRKKRKLEDDTEVPHNPANSQDGAATVHPHEAQTKEQDMEMVNELKPDDSQAFHAIQEDVEMTGVSIALPTMEEPDAEVQITIVNDCVRDDALIDPPLLQEGFGHVQCPEPTDENTCPCPYSESYCMPPYAMNPLDYMCHPQETEQNSLLPMTCEESMQAPLGIDSLGPADHDICPYSECCSTPPYAVHPLKCTCHPHQTEEIFLSPMDCREPMQAHLGTPPIDSFGPIDDHICPPRSTPPDLLTEICHPQQTGQSILLPMDCEGRVQGQLRIPPIDSLSRKRKREEEETDEEEQ